MKRHYIQRTMVVAILATLSGCLVGDDHPKMEAGNGAFQVVPPETVLAEMSEATRSEFDRVLPTISIPTNSPFRDEVQLNEVFTDWYRNGYAFAFVTGQEWLPDQIRRHDAEKAKMQGWFQGTGAGARDRFSRELPSLLERLQGGQETRP